MEKTLTPIAQALLDADTLIEQNPYKKLGDRDSYSQYREGYNDAMGDIIDRLQNLLPKEKEVIEKAFEDGFCDGIQVPQKINRTAYEYFETNYIQTP